MMPAMGKRTFSSARWRTLIAAQQTSGLSIAAFCRRAKMPPASFYTWRRKLRDTVSFAEVKIAPEPVCATSGIELHLPGQRCVVVRAGFDRQTLLDLLATLETGG
jgi:transposase-like protein